MKCRLSGAESCRDGFELVRNLHEIRPILKEAHAFAGPEDLGGKLLLASFCCWISM